MTCDEARIFIQDRVDGLLPATDSMLLEQHLGGCSRCRAELHELLAIDAALADSAVIPAPRWLPGAVAEELARRASTRRRLERIAIGACLPAAAAAAAALRPLTMPDGGFAAKARLADAAARSWQPVGESLAAVMRAPGFATSWSQNPGAQGFVLALAAAALALLAVVALKLSKQLNLEWR